MIEENYKCALCLGKIIKKKSFIEFNSKKLGKIIVPNIKFYECENCHDRFLDSFNSDKMIDYVQEMEKIFEVCRES